LWRVDAGDEGELAGCMAGAAFSGPRAIGSV
jgi:hypothetical protein